MTDHDRSFLAQLKSREGLRVGVLTDVRTLQAVLAAGDLSQRREAVRRLGVLARNGGRGAMELLGTYQDVEVAYELLEERTTLSGGRGRTARGEKAEILRQAVELRERVTAYWDGTELDDPVLSLRGGNRSRFFLMLRGFSDPVVGHLGALLEGCAGEPMGHGERLSLVGDLRFSAEPRLVATLGRLMVEGDPRLATGAARALARVNDPRAAPLLARSFERSVLQRERIVLAGCLGRLGDGRGRDYVGELLRGDPTELDVLLEALRFLGTPDDARWVLERFGNLSPSERDVAIAMVGACADGELLVAVQEVRDRSEGGGSRSQWEDAMAVIHARMELKGEIAPNPSLVKLQKRAIAGAPTGQVTWSAWLRAWWHEWIGSLWLALGRMSRAVTRFERASALRPLWAPPVVGVALAEVRAGRHGQAVAHFRKALELNRVSVEGQPWTATAAANSFLWRAGELEGEGRYDIAKGLVDEAVRMDLRRVASAVQFELSRKRERLLARLTDARKGGEGNR